MDEFVIIDRKHEVNVCVHDHDVWVTVESHDDRATVRLNMTQAKKLAAMLTEAVQTLHAT